MEPMHKINKVEVRNLQIEDYAQLSQSFKRVYADKDVFWTHEQIETLIRIFPEGQVVTVVDEKIVGCALSIIVDYDMVKGDHTYAKVTGNETSALIIRMGIYCMALKFSFIRIIADCVWHAVCMNTARNFARH